LTKPLVRNAQGKLEPATWDHALRHAAAKLKEILETRRGSAIGVIGSNRTTNEENYLLQKFARTVLGTNNIDHERSTDYAAFARALAGHKGKTAGLREIAAAPALLLVGGNPTEEHPLLAWLLRTDVRLNRARLYVANAKPIKLERQAKATQEIPAGGYAKVAELLEAGESEFAKAVLAEESLVLIFGEEFRGDAVEKLIAWGLKRDNVRFAYLGDHANSRGAADMGLFPDLLPGYVPVTAPGAFVEYPNLGAEPGKTIPQMMDAARKGDLGALFVVGANPIADFGLDRGALKSTFVIVQDMFLTETAALADVVLPAASLYEKAGTVTNTFGDVQLVRKAADRAGTKPDFEILVRLAGGMGVDVSTLVPFGKRGTTGDLGQSRGAQSGEADRHSVWLEANGLEPKLSPFDPFAVLDEIERLVSGYALDRFQLFAGNGARTDAGAGPGFVPVAALAGAELVRPAHDTLFTSGTLGFYSRGLREIDQHQAREMAESAAD
jgi:NADH-quinone oxidoreductase subunit G